MAAVDSFQLLYAEISRSCSGYYDALALAGALYAASRAALLLRACCSLLRVHFLPRVTPRRKLVHRFGQWAVVYGASEPVARAYAKELARNGVSIIFVTQSHASVRDAAASLSQNYGVETVVVLADFSLDQAARKPVLEAVSGRDVGFLVTSVDASLAPPRCLAEASEQDLMDELNRNVVGATLMVRLVLPGMVERGRGAVVNISPGGGRRPTLGRAALSGAAGFVERLSTALQLEYSSKGIFIQSLLPLQISSSRQTRDNWLVPRPDVYARHAVTTLGVSHHTTGYWPHTLQVGLMRSLPHWLLASPVLETSG